MKRALFLTVSLLASPVHLSASPTFHLITESDPGGPNNVVLSSYDSLTDLANLSATNTSPIFGFPSAISISGLTFDGTQLHIITESDPGGPNNVVLSSYDSLTDLANLSAASTSAIFGFPSAVSISGLTFDGTQFHIITESDPGGPNNVVLSSYDSLTDLVNLSAADTSPIFGFPSAVSISGLTFDGTQFHIITESDPGGPNNVVLSSYDSLTDLVNLSAASTSPIFGFPSAVSVSGLMSIAAPVNGVPEPASLSLVVLGGLAVLTMTGTRRRRTSGQSSAI
jgi:hypothetical protein